MFGVVEIDNEYNRRLGEKAGREGFRENKAYRQFKSILKQFFLQMAADFSEQKVCTGERFEKTEGGAEKIELDRRRREKLGF